MTENGKERVYLTLHQNFVRENIPYTDRKTGERRTFNQVTLPAGTVVDGEDLGGWQFSPLFVDPSKYKGESWRDIPLIADREVWLRRAVMDAEGNPIPDENGKNQTEVKKVSPQAIKEALVEARRAWARDHEAARPLSEQAANARECSEVIAADPTAREAAPER